jgi:hypothetical protein
MNRSNTWKLGVLVVLTLIFLAQSGLAKTQNAGNNGVYLPTILNRYTYINWVFEETFDGDPGAPSQTLLPDSFDYVVTHRTHPAEHFRVFTPYMADHAHDCTGPNPSVNPLPQHSVHTSHESHSADPDQSFFICKDHMMTSMGEVDGYSVTAFWPRQEFDFSTGGYLEFEVNISDNHARSWFEVMITPRSELKVGAAHHYLPIDERYPKDRIVFEYAESRRYIQVGAGALDPAGMIVEKREDDSWREQYPSDPANNDRRVRRTMRIYLGADYIIWSIERADGEFDDYRVNVPGGLPFDRGLVVFKTHAYTPTKEGNVNNYTFHWDNIRFSGPEVGRYEAAYADDVVYLQNNGDRPIGDKATNRIVLDEVGRNPVLFGQVHSPQSGQVLLSVNGRSNITIHPYDYNPGTCSSSGWKSFQLPINPAWLKEGSNTFTWTVGPSPNCAESYLWDGFSIKAMQLQFDTPN